MAVAVIPTPIIWGKLGVADCAVAGICPWLAAAAAAAEAGTFEIKAMKSSTIIRVLTLGCPVCVDDELALVLELVTLLFAVVAAEGCCSPNKLDSVSLAAPLSVEVLILVPLVEVSCVLAGVAEPGCDTLDMIVVREIPP